MATLFWAFFALSIGVVFSSDFNVKEGIRCNGHYRVGKWAVNPSQECESQCKIDNDCAAFSFEAKGDKGCFFFQGDSQCNPSLGWSTGFKDQSCGEATEDNSLTVSCPFGAVITDVIFASYGNPSGSCGSFAQSSCHVANSVEIVKDLCLGENTCTVSASENVFGNPCPVVQKNLRVQVQCGAGPNFNEDVYFNAWSSRYWVEAETEIESRKTLWQQALASTPAYPVGKYNGKGIIIVAGGKYLQPAIVMIKLLREAGCTLRIQIWHLGSSEMTPAHKQLLAPYNVETRDFEDFVSPDQLKPIAANVGMRLFQLKPLAILHSDLEDVLLLDSDNCPIHDPSYLFDAPEYTSVGTVFWPDFWKTSLENPIWAIVGEAPQDSWEQESGQLLINKQKSWKALNLAVHFNNEFYMRLLNGDKDTFRFAWMASNTEYFMVQTWPVAVGTLKELHTTDQSGFCGHTMLQHDLNGKALFVHHNQLKTDHLPIGENFKYQKSILSSPEETAFKAAPVAGLKFSSDSLLSCTDIQGIQGPFDNEKVKTERSELADFETKYFAAAASIPQDLFASKDSRSLLSNNPQPYISARSRRSTTCNSTQFAFDGAVCEVTTSCLASETQISAPTGASDRECRVAVIPGPNSGSTYTLTYDSRPNQGPRYRFSTAYSSDALVVPVIDLRTGPSFKAKVPDCSAACNAHSDCQGFFIHNYNSRYYCSLLKYLGHREASLLESQSYTRS